MRVAGLSISDLGFGIWDLKDDVSELRDTGCGVRVAGYGLRVFRFRIVSIGDFGLRISDLMAKRMAHKNS
ncbi:MAG: hypothetical protein JRF47_16280 [Deltaproteobacteria bacterium]|nr:hypothetical protein [Deltaproteobacteria bacterium]